MHIVIFGAGGVGGYFGGRLARAGERVTFIARGEHLHVLLTHGLKVDSINGNFTIKTIVATDKTTAVKAVDIILVCVKTWQLSQAANAILPMLSSKTFIIPLENGVDSPSQLARVLGMKHVLGGLCRIASHIEAPGYIQHTGIEPYVAFGELDNHPSSRTQDLLKCFERAGVKADIPDDINVAVWQKFLFISVISGIGAVTRVPVGAFRSLPATRQMLEDGLRECYSVALAQGINLPPESVNTTLEYIDSLPPDTIPSMQRDIMDGHPSELEAQSGMIVRLGQIHNIPTPVHAFIYHSLLPQERLAHNQLD
jgi:2-dehydropantoate 2-reductase